MTGNGTVQIFNSTFAKNNAAAGSEISLNGTTALQGDNTVFACISESVICSKVSLTASINLSHSILGAGALETFGLSVLAGNGGPTQTMALYSNSPLIDAGDDSVCTNSTVNNMDQRGKSRMQGSHCDIGAYEDQVSILYVKQGATGANNGTSWANAYTDLQTALSTAASDDEIWVAAGTYKPTTGTDRSISFTLKNNVAIFGGFAGAETVRSQRDFATNVAILSGDIGVAGVNTDNSYHVVVGSNTNSSTILDGFTITDGNADTNAPLYNGGGIYSYLGNLTLSNLIIKENTAVFGGGMFSSGWAIDRVAHPSLTNVTFINNTAIGEGGGMENRDYSSPILTNVSFIGNTSNRSGGGMLNLAYCDSILTNVIFSSNTTALSGGGLSNLGSKATLTNVTFSGNSSANWGGGMDNAGSSNSTLTNVTFTGNTATTFGGAISNQINANLTLTNGTINGNSADTYGDGIYNDSSTLTVHNSILYGNGEEIYGSATVTYSIVQGSYTGTGNLDANPLLGSLQNNGSFTQTMALLPGSPAIDSADDTNCPTTDQRGVTRPQGSHCDIGAYEYVHPIVPIPSPTPSDTPTPRYPVLKSGVLTPSSLTSQFGTTSGSSSSLNLLDQSGTQDNPDAYVSFQTLDNTVYLGSQSFTLPEDAQSKLVSTMLLQVNFKAPAFPHQVWTWSVYNWSTGMWIPIGDSIGTTPDEWQTLLFRIRLPRRYVSAAGEIRIQLQSENAGGAVKIDYEALHITYLSTPATATPEIPVITSDRPSIFSVPATPRP